MEVLRNIAMDGNDGSRAFIELDKRFFVIKNESIFYQFQVPGSENSRCFALKANFSTFEHPSMFQKS